MSENFPDTCRNCGDSLLIAYGRDPRSDDPTLCEWCFAHPNMVDDK